MKKIKKISVRISAENYNLLYNDYLRLKKRKEMSKLLYRQEVKTFSDYIRLMLNIVKNDFIERGWK